MSNVNPDVPITLGTKNWVMRFTAYAMDMAETMIGRETMEVFVDMSEGKILYGDLGKIFYCGMLYHNKDLTYQEFAESIMPADLLLKKNQTLLTEALRVALPKVDVPKGPLEGEAIKKG